jgi:hypothetical protein
LEEILNVVVADEFSQSFCARPWSPGGEATPERYALFSQFGQPALIFEAHVNAPEEGSFTTVIYRESAVIVDWILIPQEQARRPAAQKAALRRLCHEMLALVPAVEQLGGRVPEDPMPIIEARLALLKDSKT